MTQTNNKPTVCHVLHTLSVGGAEVLAREFSRQGKHDFRFVFACLDELGSMGEELLASNYEVISLQRKPGIDIGTAKRLKAYCKAQNVDVIHAHQYTPFFYSSMSRVIGNRLPVLFTEHGRTFPDFRRSKRVFANQFLFSKKDSVIAVGNQVKRALIENEGIAEKKIEVIYNGIDVQRFIPKPEVRDQTRRNLGIESDETVIIHVARLDPLKDHLSAIRAFGLLKETPGIKLLIVGEGPESNNIKAEINNLDLQASVSMLGLRDDIPDLLNAADACLLTSRSEGIPLTLAEAMATQLPVVATKVGGVPEIVNDGETGFLCEAGDTKSLAASITELYNSPEQRAAFGQAGRRRIIEHFNADEMHKQYQSKYLQMATR